ncbi:MAG: hypothetical protein AAF733_02330, partial [Verrucomicrobiota bacterium]
REANAFAAELLMPSKRVRKEFLSRFSRVIDLSADAQSIAEWAGPSISSGFDPLEYSTLDVNGKCAVVAQICVIQDRHFHSMADSFEVSSMAMGIRLKELGLILKDGQRVR